MQKMWGWWFSVIMLACNHIAATNMEMFATDQGLQVWLCDDHGSSVVCRFVAHDHMQGKPRIYDFECPFEGFEEDFPAFLEECEEDVGRNNLEPLGIVLIGPVDRPGLEAYCSQRHLHTQKHEISYHAVQLIPSSQTHIIDLCLNFPSLLTAPQTEEELERLWAFYLVQHMAELRLKNGTLALGGEWHGAASSRYLLPSVTTTAHAVIRNGTAGVYAVLTRWLQEIQILKEQGFTESELAASKSQLQKHLYRFYSTTHDPIKMADYYASYLASALPCIDYVPFMTQSLGVVHKIDMMHIAETLKNSFLDENRFVVVHASSDYFLAADSIHNILDQHSSNALVFDVTDTPVSFDESYQLFLQLPITADEKKRLMTLMQTIAEKNLFELGFVRSKLEKEGDRLLHIHPLCSLAIFMTDPYTKKCIGDIMDSYFKGSNFVSNFSKRLKQEAQRDNLTKYVPGFCRAVKANPDQIRAYLQAKDYEQLIRYLLKLNP